MNTPQTRSAKKTSFRYAPLAAVIAALFHGTETQAAPPAAPSNIRALVLPAEVVLTWDEAEGADHYKVYRGGPNRRWILPVETSETLFRDTEFTVLPSYYQLVSVNAAGEQTASAEFFVAPAASLISLIGVNPRPVSDTAFAVAWNIMGAGDGLLEVGTNLAQMTLVGANPVPATRQELVADHLQPNTTYFYRLTCAGSNNAGFSYVNQFNTRSFTPPLPAVVSLTSPFPTLTIDEDAPASFTLTADPPGGAPVTFFVQNVPFGQLWGTPPNLTYLSNPEHPGQDYIEFGYTDGVTTIVPVRVYVTVRSIHDSPIARDQSVTFSEDMPRKFFVSASSWDAPAWNYIVMSGPTNGVLRKNEWWLSPGEYQYEPATNFTGVDHITFAAFDGQSTGNVATVRLYVSPVNDRPIVQSQSVSVKSGVTTRIALMASDPDGDFLNLNTVIPPAHGMVGWRPPLAIDYTPAPGYVGPDSYSFRLVDPSGWDATATLSITVLPENRPPLANSAAQETEYGVPVSISLTGSDPNGDALTFRLVGLPTGGTLSGTPPNLVFTPAPGFSGLTGFLFRANDGTIDSDVATNLITVGSASAPPNPPTALTAVAVSRAQINLSWVDNSGRENGFLIERSTDNRKWTQIAVLNRDVLNYSSIGLKKATTYYHRVRAWHDTAVSAYSNTTSTQTPK